MLKPCYWSFESTLEGRPRVWRLLLHVIFLEVKQGPHGEQGPLPPQLWKGWLGVAMCNHQAADSFSNTCSRAEAQARALNCSFLIW